jgi:hypothetical protein
LAIEWLVEFRLGLLLLALTENVLMTDRLHLSVGQFDVGRDIHHHLQVAHLFALGDLLDQFSGLLNCFRNELLVPPDVACLCLHHQRLLHWCPQLGEEELLGLSWGSCTRSRDDFRSGDWNLVLRPARFANSPELQFAVWLLLACLRDVEREDLAPVLESDTLTQLGIACLGGCDQDDGPRAPISSGRNLEAAL